MQTNHRFNSHRTNGHRTNSVRQNRWCRYALSLTLSLACLGPALANQPIDNKTKAALYDIDRAEKQLAGASALKAAKLNRIQRSISNARAQLKASANQSHPAWLKASERLTGLKQRLAQMTRASQGNPPLAKPLMPAPASVSPRRRPAISQAEAYQQAQLATLNRQLDGLFQRVQQLDVLDFSEPRVAAQWRANVDRMQKQFATISSSQQPPVVATGQKVQALDTLIEQSIVAANESVAALGDVAALTQAIDERSRVAMPPVPDKPLTGESIRLFAQRLKAMSESTRADHRALLNIKGKTRAVPASRIDSLLAATGEHRQESIRSHTYRFAQSLASAFSTTDFFAAQPAQTKVQHLDRNTNALREAIDLLEVVDVFEHQTGVEVLDTASKRKTYENAVAHLVARADESVEQRRFPPARSTDPSLLAAAREVLGRDSVRVNPIQRIVITYDKQRKSTTEGEIDWGHVMTTVTTTAYEWDEFAVTTAELVDGETYLYYNLFKFFHQGGTDVPTGRWSLAKRHQKGRILEQHIAE